MWSFKPNIMCLIKFIRMLESFYITRAYQIDAGLDLYYVENQPLILTAEKVTLIDTSIAFEIPPPGTYAQIAPRSSLAKKGIDIVEGVCNAGYTGNIIVQLKNTTGRDIIMQRNDKITQ